MIAPVRNGELLKRHEYLLNLLFICWFLVLGILHGVKDKISNDVSGAVVGPIFNSHKLEDDVSGAGMGPIFNGHKLEL